MNVLVLSIKGDDSVHCSLFKLKAQYVISDTRGVNKNKTKHISSMGSWELLVFVVPSVVTQAGMPMDKVMFYLQSRFRTSFLTR